MNLWKTLRDAFRREPMLREGLWNPKAPPATYRNKVGGLARVRVPHDPTGGQALDGCYVTTLGLDVDGFWVIEPILSFTARVDTPRRGGPPIPAGDVARVTSMHDDVLEPVPHVPDTAQDESARWLPTVPNVRKVTP